MQFITAFIVAASLLAQARGIPNPLDHEIRAPDVCGYPTVPLLVAVSGPLTDRLYTTDANEVENALASGKYAASSVIAYIYSNTTGRNVPNAVPLYRIYDASGTDHYITTSETEVQAAVDSDGYEYQGITGYVYDQAQTDCAGTVPLYRSYNPSLPVHYYTTNSTDEAKIINVDDYDDEGITAYVFAP